MSELEAALESIDLEILKYDPKKQRPVSTSRGTMSVEKFAKLLSDSLGENLIDYPAVFKATRNTGKLQDILHEYAEEKKILKGDRIVEVPADFQALTLNMDISSPREAKFFMTTDEEIVSVISGSAYVKIMQMPEPEAIAAARKVLPEYAPRAKKGVMKKTFEDNNEVDVFNTYVPPRWKRCEDYKKLPDRLPPLFDKLVKHLFPIPEEREYFFSWLYYSMFKRAFVYLILCGPPGTGKNRLKLVMRALHGHVNTIDGKRSTLVERFNSQLADSTLAWFDELHYEMEMENMMKELQNDSISIERKGIDATRSTNVHASLVISNNKPRDNYIAFDARKFAPLQLTQSRLEASMDPAEIAELTAKVETPDSPDFDIDFIAQIAKWVRAHGRSPKWPHLEYKGPMFYKLAHTSMSRWQKKAATLVLDSANVNMSSRIVTDDKKGFLWSTLSESATRKNGDRSLQFPDYTTVKHFFDIFVDSHGRKAFKTSEIQHNIMGDFWVKKIIDNIKIVTEGQILGEKSNDGKNTGTKARPTKKEDKEFLDL